MCDQLGEKIVSLAAPSLLLMAALLAAAPAGAGSPAVSDLPADLLADAGALPSTENAWWLLGGAALSLLAYEIEDADGISRALDQGLIDSFADFGNIWGDMRVQAPLAAGCWIIGGTSDNDELAGLGYDLSRSLMLTYGTVSAIKLAVGRTRPNGEDYSFPSGHTAAAFSTAGVMSRRHPGWATGAAVGLGVLTALGRMEDMKHYASDVAAGATIGWIVGRTVARAGRSDDRAWQLVPSPGGLAVAGRF